ncbi:tRNA (guanine(26)-N(2))-dimethyltransferase-like isoform X2 [Gigantopelta aegis]|uniref:tRNA (guanine(26)-N(2))-dimethyltransferase-like isoform X2 n=1 Tax=Gigantopelta aegis TaxID=1735272 RepID=UPI001B88AE4D|nr:tRNA (guanine(26)-N(2))-dimethyltransferase-like isoform X2 [Gigantopelta aegis]
MLRNITINSFLFIRSCRKAFCLRHFRFSVSCIMSCEETDSIVVHEGKAEVHTPKSVFYNPVQEFNRDLTVAVISQYAQEYFENQKSKPNRRAKKTDEDNTPCSNTGNRDEIKTSLENIDISGTPENGNADLKCGESFENGIRIFEGLAASGLRSVRFGLEIPGVKEVIANDFDKNAVSFIEKNIEKNSLQGLVKSSCGDAAMVMYQNKSVADRFDVIDLDPYGSPSVFLDAAVQAVKDGGLLCVTCTDLAVMCGNAGETCYSKYGSMSLKGKFCHEMALRIILQSIESHANRYSRYIVPLISMSADFYLRVFVKVFTGQIKVKEAVSKLAMVYLCTGCGAYSLQRLGVKVPTKGDNVKFNPCTGPPVGPRCDHCGFKHHFGGPIWVDPIHDVDFIQSVLRNIQEDPNQLRTSERIVGMLSVMSEELPDVPLYYILDELCNTLHCTPLSLQLFRSAVLNAGYRVSMSHAAKNSHKTDAPMSLIWDIMREWIKDNPVKLHRLKEGTPVKCILEKEQKHRVSFDLHPDANPKSRQQGLLRWQKNPEREWGPKPRAKKSGNSQTMVECREEKQGKRKAKQVPPDYRKQFPCKKFKQGHCEHGSDCCYSHEMVSTEDAKTMGTLQENWS